MGLVSSRNFRTFGVSWQNFTVEYMLSTSACVARQHAEKRRLRFLPSSFQVPLTEEWTEENSLSALFASARAFSRLFLTSKRRFNAMGASFLLLRIFISEKTHFTTSRLEMRP